MIRQRKEHGGIDGLLVLLRAKLGTMSRTKKLTQPIVLLSLVINAALILAYDHNANDETFSPATYSRWHPAYYVLLCAAPAHTTLNVLSFAAFLRIDAQTMVDSNRRKVARQADRTEEGDEDSTFDPVQNMQDIAAATAIALQETINHLPYGHLIPIEIIYILRSDFGFWWAILNICSGRPPGRLSALSILHSKSILYGAFVHGRGGRSTA